MATVREYPYLHRAIIIITVVLVLLLAYSIFDTAMSVGRIHPGVTVSGVDVGGMKVDEAADVLNQQLGDELSSNLIVVFADQSAEDNYSGTGSSSDEENTDYWKLSADTVGASVDGEMIAQTAYDSTRGKGHFIKGIKAWFGKADFDAIVSCDYSQFYKATSAIESSIGTPITNADIVVNDGVATMTAGSPGYLIDYDAFVREISRAFLSDDHTCIATMVTKYPRISDEQAQEVAEQVNSTIAQDIVYTYEGQSWDLTNAELGTFISTRIINNWDGAAQLEAYVDSAKVSSTMHSVLGDAAGSGAQDAYYDVSSGEPVLVPSVQGTGPDLSKGASDTQALLFGGVNVDRSITLTPTAVDPAITTDIAQSYGIKELIASYTTDLSGSEERKHNIRLLLDTLSYNYIAPGAEWSFNNFVGDTTEDKGYESAHTIVDGVLEESIGGGACQVATTVFNAVYESGLPVIERHNHSIYFSSYPTGRDSTISYGGYDLVWQNDTSNWILMTTSYDDDSLTVYLWGTSPNYTVETTTSDWTIGEAYTTRYMSSTTVAAGDLVQAGADAMSILVQRYVYDSGGNLVREDDFYSYYPPTPEVISTGP